MRNLITMRKYFIWSSNWFCDYNYYRILFNDLKINNYLKSLFYRLKLPTSQFIITRSYNKIYIEFTFLLKSFLHNIQHYNKMLYFMKRNKYLLLSNGTLSINSYHIYKKTCSLFLWRFLNSNIESNSIIDSFKFNLDKKKNIFFKHQAYLKKPFYNKIDWFINYITQFKHVKVNNININCRYDSFLDISRKEKEYFLKKKKFFLKNTLNLDNLKMYSLFLKSKLSYFFFYKRISYINTLLSIQRKNHLNVVRYNNLIINIKKKMFFLKLLKNLSFTEKMYKHAFDMKVKKYKSVLHFFSCFSYKKYLRNYNITLLHHKFINDLLIHINKLNFEKMLNKKSYKWLYFKKTHSFLFLISNNSFVSIINNVLVGKTNYRLGTNKKLVNKVHFLKNQPIKKIRYREKKLSFLSHFSKENLNRFKSKWPFSKLSKFSKWNWKRTLINGFHNYHLSLEYNIYLYSKNKIIFFFYKKIKELIKYLTFIVAEKKKKNITIKSLNNFLIIKYRKLFNKFSFYGKFKRKLFHFFSIKKGHYNFNSNYFFKLKKESYKDLNNIKATIFKINSFFKYKTFIYKMNRIFYNRMVFFRGKLNKTFYYNYYTSHKNKVSFFSNVTSKKNKKRKKKNANYSLSLLGSYMNYIKPNQKCFFYKLSCYNDYVINKSYIINNKLNVLFYLNNNNYYYIKNKYYFLYNKLVFTKNKWSFFINKFNTLFFKSLYLKLFFKLDNKLIYLDLCYKNYKFNFNLRGKFQSLFFKPIFLNNKHFKKMLSKYDSMIQNQYLTKKLKVLLWKYIGKQSYNRSDVFFSQFKVIYNYYLIGHKIYSSFNNFFSQNYSFEIKKKLLILKKDFLSNRILNYTYNVNNNNITLTSLTNKLKLSSSFHLFVFLLHNLIYFFEKKTKSKTILKPVSKIPLSLNVNSKKYYSTAKKKNSLSNLRLLRTYFVFFGFRKYRSIRVFYWYRLIPFCIPLRTTEESIPLVINYSKYKKRYFFILNFKSRSILNKYWRTRKKKKRLNLLYKGWDPRLMKKHIFNYYYRRRKLRFISSDYTYKTARIHNRRYRAILRNKKGSFLSFKSMDFFSIHSMYFNRFCYYSKSIKPLLFNYLFVKKNRIKRAVNYKRKKYYYEFLIDCWIDLKLNPTYSIIRRKRDRIKQKNYVYNKYNIKLKSKDEDVFIKIFLTGFNKYRASKSYKWKKKMENYISLQRCYFKSYRSKSPKHYKGKYPYLFDYKHWSFDTLIKFVNFEVNFHLNLDRLIQFNDKLKKRYSEYEIVKIYKRASLINYNSTFEDKKYIYKINRKRLIAYNRHLKNSKLLFDRYKKFVTSHNVYWSDFYRKRIELLSTLKSNRLRFSYTPKYKIFFARKHSPIESYFYVNWPSFFNKSFLPSFDTFLNKFNYKWIKADPYIKWFVGNSTTNKYMNLLLKYDTLNNLNKSLNSKLRLGKKLKKKDLSNISFSISTFRRNSITFKYNSIFNLYWVLNIFNFKNIHFSNFYKVKQFHYKDLYNCILEVKNLTFFFFNRNYLSFTHLFLFSKLINLLLCYYLNALKWKSIYLKKNNYSFLNNINFFSFLLILQIYLKKTFIYKNLHIFKNNISFFLKHNGCFFNFYKYSFLGRHLVTSLFSSNSNYIPMRFQRSKLKSFYLSNTFFMKYFFITYLYKKSTKFNFLNNTLCFFLNAKGINRIHFFNKSINNTFLGNTNFNLNLIANDSKNDLYSHFFFSLNNSYNSLFYNTLLSNKNHFFFYNQLNYKFFRFFDSIDSIYPLLGSLSHFNSSIFFFYWLNKNVLYNLWLKCYFIIKYFFILLLKKIYFFFNSLDISFLDNELLTRLKSFFSITDFINKYNYSYSLVMNFFLTFVKQTYAHNYLEDSSLFSFIKDNDDYTLICRHAYLFKYWQFFLLIENTIGHFTNSNCFLLVNYNFHSNYVMNSAKMWCDQILFLLKKRIHIKKVFFFIRKQQIKELEKKETIEINRTIHNLLIPYKYPLQGIRILYSGNLKKARRKQKVRYHLWVSDVKYYGPLSTNSLKRYIDYYHHSIALKNATIGIKLWLLFHI